MVLSSQNPGWAKIRIRRAGLMTVAGMWALLSCTSTLRGQDQNTKTPPEDAPQEARPILRSASPILHWFTIGPLDEPRPIRQVLQKEGWHGVVRSLEPVFDWFRQAGQIPRVLVHLPFATDGTPPMDYDAYLRAYRSQMWLYRDFVDAWQPLTQAADPNQRVELICYVGAIQLDPDMVAEFKDESTRGTRAPARWLYRAAVSLDPILAAGASVAFDSASQIKPDSPEYHFVETIEALFKREGAGRYIMIEALPRRDKPSWRRISTIMTNHYWRSFGEKKSHWEEVFRPEEMTGEVVLMVQRPPPGQNWTHASAWLPEEVRRFRAMGFSCAVDVHRLIQVGVSYSQIETMGEEPSP